MNTLRVWHNTSAINWSFVDYRAMTTGSPCVYRQEVAPGVGIRLPKSLIEVLKVGVEMKEGRTE